MTITQKTTPNKWSGRPGNWKPDMIVSHITDGAFDGAVAWLQNPQSQCSSHFVVARDGRVVQLVPLTDGAWCNGISDAACAKSTLQLVRDRKTNPNYYTVSIEHEGYYKDTGGALTDAQLLATTELHKHIISEVKRIYGVTIPVDREHLAGHYQISPDMRPNCPGQLFQWDKLLAGIKGQNVTPPADDSEALRSLNSELSTKLARIKEILEV